MPLIFKYIQRFIKVFLMSFVILIAVLAIVGLLTHKSLPDNSNRTASTHLPPNPDGHFFKILADDLSTHTGKSGIYSLANGRDAFLARLALVEKHSIHLIYNIIFGTMIFQAGYLPKVCTRRRNAVCVCVYCWTTTPWQAWTR